MGIKQRRPRYRGGPCPHPSDHPLRLWRLAQRLSIEAVAAALGVSTATISRLERGLQTPSLRLVEKLWRATDGKVPVAAFWEKTGWDNDAEVR
jgi:predicted transcriptional regulator